MFRFRGKPTTMHARLIDIIAGDAQADSAQLTVAIKIVEAVFAGESIGTPATLRQIHRLVGLTQAEALRTVSEMEREGLIVIHSDINDAFESELGVDSEISSAIERKNARKVA